MRKKTNDEVDNRAYKFRIYPNQEQEVLMTHDPLMDPGQSILPADHNKNLKFS